MKMKINTQIKLKESKSVGQTEEQREGKKKWQNVRTTWEQNRLQRGRQTNFGWGNQVFEMEMYIEIVSYNYY